MTLPLASTIAARFPLVPRKRPPAKPLDARVNRLAALAETAHREHDPETASMVFNGAALVASDCGDTQLARTWCHQHANLYLSRTPLSGHTARFALEPVINLARLRIRDGDGGGAHRLLTDLHASIVSGRRAVIDDLEIHPQQLIADSDELQQIIVWLRSILLSDGTRALTLAGRWVDALTHVRHHDGISTTLLDGRQAAIVAHLIQGDKVEAAALLSRTKIEQPWERAVHDLLECWHATTIRDAATPDFAGIVDRSSATIRSRGLSVFRVRLSLTALDLAVGAPPHVADDLVKLLTADVIRDEDAHAARDLLNHPAVGPEHHRPLSELIELSGLGRESLPDTAQRSLSLALALAGTVIDSASKRARY
ncbi:hypothetical protein [Micromonospora inaquosa]|uniref:Uncharacterized protein n=1 Tax=Micromonospora inaquosa TaxID=2203716 RepID=A0A3N9WI62_9ACTN|nr:hypothetical protein [Micromonospora inaquosa]RQX00498.1 hypothetical protein DLJ59_21150 [Micromonospora inaquosa]